MQYTVPERAIKLWEEAGGWRYELPSEGPASCGSVFPKKTKEEAEAAAMKHAEAYAFIVIMNAARRSF